MERARTFIVIDISNHAYDSRLAHEIKTVFPIYVLQNQNRRQSGKLADLHNVQDSADIMPLHLSLKIMPHESSTKIRDG